DAEIPFALCVHVGALLRFFLFEIVLDFLVFLLRKLLHCERLGYRRLLHPFLFFIRSREIAAVDHVELLLRDAFFFQLAVSFVGVLREIGVLFLQRRDAVFAERERGGSGRGFGGRQRFGLKLARRGRRRSAHVLECRDDRALVCLDHLQHFCTGVLCFLVALEVVDVFDLLRNVFSQVLLKRLFAFVWIDFRRGTIADDVDLAGVALRLPLAIGNHLCLF